MNRTLLDITEDLQALDDLLTEAGGDITGVEATVDAWLAELERDLKGKVDNYAALITAMIRLPPPSAAEVERQLRQPLHIRGRQVRYRFAGQKSRYIAGALQALSQSRPDTTSGLAFRSWFLHLDGVGPKTASWITRNWLACDDVAIIDIHVSRALALAGTIVLDSPGTTSYFDLEKRFLDFSSAIDERPSLLDAVIWRQMRLASGLVRWRLRTRSTVVDRQVA